MEGPKKIQRIYVPTNYDDCDIELYDGDVDDFSAVPGQSVEPMIAQIESFRLEDVPHVVPVKEVDMWILSVEGEVDDSAIAGLIDMNTWDYREHMEKNFKAFPYINSLAIKKIRDAQMAADWINSKILMAAMAERQE